MDLAPGLKAFFEACKLASEVLHDETVADRWRDASALEGGCVNPWR